MKKLQKLAIVFTAFVFSFFSCAQITDPVNVNTNETTKFGSKQITITVASSEDIVKFETNSNARTILPDALVSGNLDYYMWDDKDSSSTPEEVTFTAKAGSNTEGTVSKALEAKEYTLILAAVPSDYDSTITKTEILQAALLTASATIDFRYTDKVHFYLTPNKTTGVTGDIDLTLKGIGEDWVQSDILTVTASMYKKDGTLVDSSTSENLKDSFFTTEGSNYTLSNIDAGIYIFEIVFETSNDKTYKWNDDLIILPNQTTTKTVNIPNIIGKKPDAPVNFIAGYTIPENNTDEYYTVTLNWDDDANNEFYYDLEVIELSAIPTVTTWSDETWTTLATTSTTKLYSGVEDTNRKLFADSADCLVYNSGNLYRNSESVTMKLILGSLYFARIRAANVAGESAWVYLDLNNNPTDTVKFTSKVMNLFKVSYDLRGGTIDPANGLTSYYNVTDTPVDILKPKTSATDTESTITVTLGEKYWKKWTTAKGDDFTGSTYSGFKNLELFANYDTNMDVTIVNPQDYELMNTITVKAGTTPIDPTDSTYTYNIKGGDLTISYAIDTDTPAYDKFEFIITSPINDYFKLKAEGTKASDNASATFDANKFSTGTYIFTIAAYIDGKKYTTWSVLNVIEQ